MLDYPLANMACMMHRPVCLPLLSDADSILIAMCRPRQDKKITSFQPAWLIMIMIMIGDLQ